MNTIAIEHGLEWICETSDYKKIIKCPDCKSKQYIFTETRKGKNKNNKIVHMVYLQCRTCHCKFAVYREE